MGDFGARGSLDWVGVKAHGDSTCYGLPMTGATNWDYQEASLTPSGMSGTTGRPQDG